MKHKMDEIEENHGLNEESEKSRQKRQRIEKGIEGKQGKEGRKMEGSVTISVRNTRSEVTHSYSTYPLKIMQQEGRKMEGSVTISVRNTRSEVTHSYSTYPLKIMQQEIWNSHVTLSLLGYGGGMVSGDRISLNVLVEEGATACIKTVGSTKIFKAIEEQNCTQEVCTVIQKNGFLVMIPDPITCYEHSRLCLKQRYIVDDNSSAVIVDWFSSGRVNRNERWMFDTFENHFIQMNQDNRFLLVENQLFHNVDPENNPQSFGYLAKEFQMNVWGMLVLYGPKTESIRSSLKCFQARQTFEERCAEKHSVQVISVFRKSDQLSVVRLMIPSMQYGYELLMEILKPLSLELNNNIPYQDRVHYQQDSLSTFHGESIPSPNPIEILKTYRSRLEG